MSKPAPPKTHLPVFDKKAVSGLSTKAPQGRYLDNENALEYIPLVPSPRGNLSETHGTL